MMKTLFLYWLISIVIWPIFVKLAIMFRESFYKISQWPQSDIRKLSYDIGIGLLTSGFLGTLLGISFSSQHIEIIARLFLSVLFVILGINLIAKNGEDHD